MTRTWGKSMRLAVAGLAIVLPAAAGSYKCSDRAARDMYACRQVVIEHDERFDPDTLAAALGLKVIGRIPQLGQVWFETPIGTEVKRVLYEIKHWVKDHPESGVLGWDFDKVFVSPECRQINISILELRADPPADQAVFLEQGAVAAMNAWPPDSDRGAGVTVAVLDTGVSRSHVVLAGSIVSPGIDPINWTDLADDTGNGVDDDLDGVIDGGWGHGTAVAGLVHLIAPGARILPVRVLDDECKGTAFSFAAGIVAAVDAGARIVNLSLGSVEDSPIVERAISYAARRGALVLAPTGNLRRGSPGLDKIQFPARQYPEVAAVTAVDLSFVSPEWAVADSRVALSAPGIDLVAPYRDGYAHVAGTSFATALVSGAAAAALSADPALDRLELLERLRQTAIPVDARNPQRQGRLGRGVPDVAGAAARQDSH